MIKAGRRERAVSLAVYGLLAAVAVWLGLQQARFLPASLDPPPPPAAPRTADLLSGPEFHRLGPAETFGPDNLSDKIDGKADLYLISGFDRLTSQRFKIAGGWAELLLFRMTNPQAAFAVFSQQRRSDGRPIELTAQAYTTDNGLFLAWDRYYLEAVASVSGPEALAGLKKMAAAWLAAREGRAAPAKSVAADPKDLFPKEGLDRTTVTLAVGNALGFGGWKNVYLADYNLNGKAATAFIKPTGGPEQARILAGRLIAFILKNDGQELPPPAGPTGARAFSAFDLIGLIFVSGPYLAGVNQADDLKTALTLADALAQRLAKEGGRP